MSYIIRPWEIWKILCIKNNCTYGNFNRYNDLVPAVYQIQGLGATQLAWVTELCYTREKGVVRIAV